MVQPEPKNHPSGDNRFKLLDRAITKHHASGDALIEILHVAQGIFGFLENDLMVYIANALKLPLSRVYGVATFYHFFRMKPAGKHTCVVCTGTACYIKGANQILDSIQQAHGIKPGETTADGQVSVLTARCLGACGLAAAVVYDGEVAGKQDANGTLERLQKWGSQ
jgi:bidirectional [NiFe] hydrogenase diaphorase subunit